MEEAIPNQPPDPSLPESLTETQMVQEENSVMNEINIEDLERELNQRNSFEDKEWDFEADFKDLEKALDDESVEFTNDEAEKVAGQLEEVRVALEASGVKVDDVLKDFHVEIEEDMLHVTSVSAEDLLQEEKRRMDSELERARHEAEIQRRREQILEERAAEARKELNDETKKKIALITDKKKLLLLKARLEQEKMGKAFSQAESQLNKAIEERQAEVKTLYGDLRIASEQYGGARDRRWRVEWTRTPQPIQIKIDCVRGLKDKERLELLYFRFLSFMK
ncbi:unnamed protein product [Oikopleura dioica]|uniref:Uncharacterized protein n=1 Tax=Oikopleura dioica TaxID=34765 RepID=E4X9D6_OIKDI|nr:unnamed protein product [Oikopleura dioica]